jgi:long-chain acyl-CoA synthetase
MVKPVSLASQQYNVYFYLAFGEYVWKNLGDCYNDSEAFAKYLMRDALCPEIITQDGRFRFLAIFSKNREEWTVADLGAQMTSITVVTLYDTLGKDSLEYILNQTKIRTCLVTSDKMHVLLELHKEGKLEHLQHIIYLDEPKPSDFTLADSINVQLVSYATALKEGKEVATTASLEAPTPETVYTLSYTSGTTGQPKGVMITHRNMMANVGAINHFDPGFKLQSDDVYISYLPLAHVFERFLMVATMAFHVKYGYY